MELDDFKASWKASQETVINQQKLSIDKLEQIMTRTTSALKEIQKRNDYWYKLGTTVCTALIVILLVDLVIFYFAAGRENFFREKLLPVIIMLVFAVTTIWIYRRQQQIFDVPVNENIKETLHKMLTDFKRFYFLYISVYSVLFPVYFYALMVFFSAGIGKLADQNITIKHIADRLSLSVTNKAELCIGLAIICLIISHLFYKAKYFRYIKILQLNLKELEA
jgi:hypothetical protein